MNEKNLSQFPKFAVCIPVYNRERNLELTLTALKRQIYLNFEVIIADDGSTDETAKIVKAHQDTGSTIKYTYLGKNKGYRQARARNNAAKMADSDVDAFIFLDADVLLPPNALALYVEDWQKNHNRVICGMYNWGKPIKITPEDVYNYFNDVVKEKFPEIEGAQPHGMLGDDIRKVTFDEKNIDDLCFDDGNYLATFGGNLLVPKKIFLECAQFNKTYNPKVNDDWSGYDQYFTAPIEDGDFGLTIRDVGYPVSFDRRIVGYHVWHPRNLAEIQKISAEQVPYLDKKHQADVVKMTQQIQRKWLPDKLEKKMDETNGKN